MEGNKRQERNWIIRFLKKGTFLGNLRLHTKIAEAYNILGMPKDEWGTEEWGWILEFGNGIRIRYLDNLINELAILFKKNNVSFPVIVTSYEKTISHKKYIEQITHKTTIHEFIRVLHYNRIKWKSCDEKSHDCLSIVTESNVLVMFDLNNGRLFRIVYSDISIGLGKRAFGSC